MPKTFLAKEHRASEFIFQKKKLNPKSFGLIDGFKEYTVDLGYIELAYNELSAITNQSSRSWSHSLNKQCSRLRLQRTDTSLRHKLAILKFIFEIFGEVFGQYLAHDWGL